MSFSAMLGSFSIRRVRLFAGLVLGLYVTLHLSNHALGLISVDAQERARPYVMAMWHTAPGQVLLYGSVIVHALLALYAVGRRRQFRAPRWEWVQVIFGLAIPYLLLVHIMNTRGTRVLTQIDIDYVYEIANLWVDPSVRFRQVLLVLLVWVHFVVGLHYWLRYRVSYRKYFAGILLAYVLLPTMALLGFAEVGMTMTKRAKADPAWWAEISTRGKPADKASAKLRSDLKAWAPPAWLGLVALVFVGAQVRNLVERRRWIRVGYPEQCVVRAPRGMSILEVSRMAQRPHMSVCGGRARCTTCRIRITCDDELPTPNSDEARALERIAAPAGMRLACQLRPHCNVNVEPLLNPKMVNAGSVGRGAELGKEMHVTVLFIDVRGSTKLAENKMPFDVVFLMNHFFQEMAEAVERAGGHYSNFTGDGLMALFGLDRPYIPAARDAIACGVAMLERLKKVNDRMEGEMETPLSIGVGIHTGVAIVGRMGPPKAPLVTALGDTVNTTARLEGTTKDLGRPMVISYDTLRAAMIEDGLPLTEVSLRGRATPMKVAALTLEEAQAVVARIKTRGKRGAAPTPA